MRPASAEAPIRGLMQDFKHLTTTKRSPFSSLFGSRKSTPQNSFKRLVEPPRRKKRLRVILPALALFVAAYPILSIVLTGKPAASSVREVQHPDREPASVDTGHRSFSEGLDPYQSFQLAAQSLGGARFEGGRLISSLTGGGTLVFAINEELQRRVKEVMAENQVPYAAFVALEPKTGRVLAMTAHSSASPGWEENACYSIYPMASLFKIVTATAALEQKKVTPETVVPFRGGLYSESSRYWSALPKRGATEMDLTTAMGKSVNPVFGRLACDIAGRDSVLRCAERIGFNQPLLPGTPVQPSKAEHPTTDNDLRLMGAGLGREVKISPVHAAVLMASIANGGTMLAPSLVEEVRDEKGKLVFAHQPRPIRSIMPPEVAAQLTKMLSTTVSTGTSRRAFHDRRGRPKLADINIAAKTGSINGTDPSGHYSWFAAYAPAENPQIALATLVINPGKWKIKASQLGEQALEAFFR